MRKALILGIDHYDRMNGLHGCVNDAYAVSNILERHGDGSINFDVRLITATGSRDAISRIALKDAVEELFQGEGETALLFFAGHGHLEATGGYLIASDSQRGDDGLSLTEILTLANKSKMQNKIIILDSCHSGCAGQDPGSSVSELADGITILTASTAEQYATEENGSGVFTTLLVDALGGAAANLVGDITPGSVYAHIDQSLGSWDQRPVFKTNVKRFVSLRKVQPPIDLYDLQQLITFFPSSTSEYRLDPSYEPERSGHEVNMVDPDPNNVAKFKLLQKYHRVNLVIPVGAPHMWHAAMENKSCRLTVLGEHYRRLIERGRI